MGGGGGGGRARSMFDHDDDDDPMGSFSGIPGGFGGSAGGGAGPRRHASFRRGDSPGPATPNGGAPSEIVRPLKTTLEDLYAGAKKHLKVGRRLLGGGTEDRVLEIDVLPGWKSGTKVRFPRAGNETAPGGEAQDLVFVVEEKPHARFTREGNDLVTRLAIPLVDAIAGGPGQTRTVEHLDGRKITVQVPPSIVHPGHETRVPGEGMPVRKEGSVKKKGDLVVKWDIEFPDRLSPAQKQGIRKFMVGN